MATSAWLAVEGRPLARAALARNPWTRGRGLLGRRSLEPPEALLIEPCSSVHTWFMAFAIDVVYLDREMRVTKIVPNLRPWRFSAGRGARVVLEMPAGEAAARGLAVGDQVVELPPGEEPAQADSAGRG